MASQTTQIKYFITEACEKTGVTQSYLIHCVRSHWINPVEPVEIQFDEEDLARVRLIQELQKDFGVNDEGISIILHLLDQLYGIHDQIHKLTEIKNKF
jgi:chaperone modulatory protein CbpM